MSLAEVVRAWIIRAERRRRILDHLPSGRKQQLLGAAASLSPQKKGYSESR
jgi:hypothetical protein